ncbi:Acg family FMN-binding oxidoreductase [Kitasatospora sp. NBC_01302]|uniref:Acg family FMN-binding oxidoreductase n=1 Tax=Kitasatospora sp. NBC_01302 TaxID=2903575 RepID=UPI002E13CC1C|nr:nitroreductase family protein [Kitasatospora sp. NBC_01302]
MIAAVLDAATLEKLISAAVAAPSIHNSQPWHFTLVPRTATLEVRAAPERALPAIDPEGRALYISVGAAVLNLRLAAQDLGWAPEVTLLPDPGDPDLLAAVVLAQPAGAAPAVPARLREAIGQRHSQREPFTDQAVPTAVLTELAEAARAEDAWLYFPDSGERRRLLELTAEAERRSVTDPARSAESRSWIRGPGAAPYGIPPEALGPQDAAGRIPMRDYAGLRPAEHRAPAEFETDPCLAVLATRGDHPQDWLRAGLALEAVLLHATVHGVRATMLHQALEWSALRWEARDPERGPGVVHMLLRLGYGPEGAHTPRLGVSEVLDDGGLADGGQGGA